MRQRDRADLLREVILTASNLARDFPAMIDTLSDRRGGGEIVPVSGGDRSDPTSRAALTSVEATRLIDHHLRTMLDSARFLEDQRVKLTGSARPVELTDDRGRPTLDADGKPIDYCTLHHAALVDHPREPVPQARQHIKLPDGHKVRVCRWCADFTRDHGQAPTTAQILDHVAGRRVYVRTEEVSA